LGSDGEGLGCRALPYPTPAGLALKHASWHALIQRREKTSWVRACRSQYAQFAQSEAVADAPLWAGASPQEGALHTDVGPFVATRDQGAGEARRSTGCNRPTDARGV